MIRADEYQAANDIERRALQFFTTLMAKDIDSFAELWAEDAIQEIPFAPDTGEFDEPWKGKKKIVAYYERAIPLRRDHVYFIKDIHHTSDSDLVIIEAGARSFVTTTGRTYEQDYVFFFRFRDGKIAFSREYVNPLRYMQAFGS